MLMEVENLLITHIFLKLKYNCITPLSNDDLKPLLIFNEYVSVKAFIRLTVYVNAPTLYLRW